MIPNKTDSLSAVIYPPFYRRSCYPTTTGIEERQLNMPTIRIGTADGTPLPLDGAKLTLLLTERTQRLFQC